MKITYPIDLNLYFDTEPIVVHVAPFFEGEIVRYQILLDQAFLLRNFNTPILWAVRENNAITFKPDNYYPPSSPKGEFLKSIKQNLIAWHNR